MITHYLQAADESALIAALESAGLLTQVPEVTREVPEYEDVHFADVDEALADELTAKFGPLAEEVEYNGVAYFGDGDGWWMTKHTATVPAHTETTPAYSYMPTGVHLVKVGTISKRVGGTDDEPIIETQDGYHANLHLDERFDGDLSDEQRAKLPIIPAPKNPVSVLAGEP